MISDDSALLLLHVKHVEFPHNFACVIVHGSSSLFLFTTLNVGVDNDIPRKILRKATSFIDL